ncbi:hypothetical protein SAMN05421780_11039 [Flexibacter flexilis DSM 6793]|uniref:Uncharacterized protein n=1 Tax=Flexibacter flexilis DSM 6793 TaxID=927664 RepID=A0A1I1M5G7_9BACT|nr:hypothetical protein [Flexibacter flexilis]SFC80679.1 hypothetical protein SAMN05421780_11039 [Flexibacter flexilis DSM 6793]
MAKRGKSKFRKITEIEIKDDPIVGNFSVSFSAQYTRISVGNRHFYFNSDTGDFDGTGTKIR